MTGSSGRRPRERSRRPLRVLIVDDEYPARAELRFRLNQEPDVEITGEAAHAREAMRLIDALKYKVDADQIYYRLGNLYFDAGDLGRAEYAYRRAIEFNPRHVNAHHNLAVVYKKTGRVEESVRMQKKAVRIQVGGWLGWPARERGAAGGGRDGADDPTHHYFDPRLHDPEGFRRFGKRVALIGFLVFIGVGVAYLALVYLIGFWLF
ncbi:MAG: tetratricopeptide repeat protein [Clostridia bacterium]